MKLTLGRRVFVVASLALAMLGGGGAFGYSNGSGNSANAPGQQRAVDNCNASITRQSDAGVVPPGGRKEGQPGPTNCDHTYNP